MKDTLDVMLLPVVSGRARPVLLRACPPLENQHLSCNVGFHVLGVGSVAIEIPGKLVLECHLQARYYIWGRSRSLRGDLQLDDKC